MQAQKIMVLDARVFSLLNKQPGLTVLDVQEQLGTPQVWGAMMRLHERGVIERWRRGWRVVA